MKIIGVITARSGSKAIPNKNIRNLGGIPLLGWSLKALSRSKLIEKIIFSSDSDSYFEIAHSINSDIIFHKRDTELAEDVPSELVLLDIIKKFKNFFDDDSLIVLIQPTTPFLSGKNIDECINKLLNNSAANTCVSVKKVEEYPEWIISLKNVNTDTGLCNNITGNVGIRQNLSKRYIPNGGIYAIRKSFLESKQKIIDNETIIYEMPKLNSIDIDDEEDFIICESLIKAGLFSLSE